MLYTFARDDVDGDPRLGLAIPRAAGRAVVRNRIKRQLREAWQSLPEQVPLGRDYVLVARPGLPEAVDARGFEWLRQRVTEVLGKASA